MSGPGVQPAVSRLSASRPPRSPARLSLPSTREPSPSPIAAQLPVLLTELGTGDGESILCLVVERDRVYGGSQGGNIHVWDLTTLARKAVLAGHTGAVLALQYVPERDWLLSSSGDGTIRVWHLPTLSPLYLIHLPHDNAGDIFSVAWFSSDLISAPGDSDKGKGRGRLFAGCQDTSIQWIDLPPPYHISASSSAFSHESSANPLYNLNSPPRSSPPIYKPHNKFFDTLTLADRPRSQQISGGLGRTLAGSSSASLTSLGGRGEWDSGGLGATSPAELAMELQISDSSMVSYAHYGYVYCLLVGRSKERDVLISGSGDEMIKIWKPTANSLELLATLESTNDAVLTLAVRETTLFAGHQGGVIKIWDLDTLICIRNLRPHKEDILTISVIDSDFYSGCASGKVQHWDKGFNLVNTWKAHDHIVLASCSSGDARGTGGHLITGGNDAIIKIWDFPEDELAKEEEPQGFQGQMFHTLAKLVSFRTIADEEHREECRQGALYLKRVLTRLGAVTNLLPGETGKNPLVVATFNANSPHFSSTPTRRRRRVLCYGHYDVITASKDDKWTTDPFVMHGKNGWVYGRGVSDNKGPMLAIAAAASELRLKQELEVDLVMVVEGEEETGSAGFQKAIKDNLALIGDIDVILVSNSYWIGEEIPCLTFGLRGVVHATLSIASDQPDLHSGMQGGVVSEPLGDMVRLLSSLTDGEGRVLVPRFLDEVRVLGEAEGKLFDEVVRRCAGDKSDKLRKHSHISDPRRSLIARWRQPALSIHNVSVDGPSKTLIPSAASASISLRIVPDQSLEAIIEQLKSYLTKSFSTLRTFNTLSIDINHVADWWLGDIEGEYFKALAKCVENEWGIKPLYIREGGSIPSLPFLERQFEARAVHFPMGTSSDSAHLPDERIRIINLERGKNIIQKWFGALANLPSA